MKSIENIVNENLVEYSGKKAVAKTRKNLFVKGQLYNSDSRWFFFSNERTLDGARPSEFDRVNNDFKYSWNIMVDMLWGFGLENDEEFKLPFIKFEKLFISGNKVKFKLTEESFDSLKNAELPFVIDRKFRVGTKSGFDFENQIFSIHKTQARQLQSVGNFSKRELKYIYRFLKQKECVIEGKTYKTVSLNIRSGDLRFNDIALSGIYAFSESDLEDVIQNRLNKGLVLDIKADSIESYKEKAKKFLKKAILRHYHFQKDDAGKYIPPYSFDRNPHYRSELGTSYVYDTPNDEWIKESEAIKYYNEDFEERYVKNTPKNISQFEKTTDGKLIIPYCKFVLYGENDEKIIIHRNQRDDYCYYDNIIGEYVLKSRCVKVGGHYYAKETTQRKDVFVCSECGELEMLQNLIHIGDTKICGNCFRCSSDKFHEYGYKPKPLFHHIKGEEKTKLYFGMELEFGCSDTKEIVSLINNYLKDRENILYMKRDASVRGIEMVFQPYTFESFKEMTSKQLYPLLKTLINKGCKGHNEGGIHLHTSLDAWDSDQLEKLYTFFYKNKKNYKFILMITQRKKENLDRWGSLSNISLDDWTIRNIRDKNSGFTTRYTALNMTRHTLEFRIFNSSLRFDRILKNAEFVKSLYEFTKTSEPMLEENYLKWLKENPKGYENLISFLNEKGKI